MKSAPSVPVMPVHIEEADAAADEERSSSTDHAQQYHHGLMKLDALARARSTQHAMRQWQVREGRCALLGGGGGGGGVVVGGGAGVGGGGGVELRVQPCLCALVHVLLTWY